jgi:hypothetical protein
VGGSLFLDQYAVPTIVEVKRSDSRVRREVVGQMLDYAANAVVCWPVEALRTRFEAVSEGQGRVCRPLVGRSHVQDHPGFGQACVGRMLGALQRLA